MFMPVAPANHPAARWIDAVQALAFEITDEAGYGVGVDVRDAHPAEPRQDGGIERPRLFPGVPAAPGGRPTYREVCCSMEKHLLKGWEARAGDAYPRGLTLGRRGKVWAEFS